MVDRAFDTFAVRRFRLERIPEIPPRLLLAALRPGMLRLAAAEADGHYLEVIDLRTLSPLDLEPVFDAVRRTGRLVVVAEAPSSVSVAAEVAARVQEECFHSLESPVLRVTGFGQTGPYASRPGFGTLAEAMSDHRSDERIAVGGAANLARYGDSFDSAVRPLLEALEEHVVLLKLLGEATSGGMVTVRIGHEGPYEQLSATSVVATGYGPNDDALATLGVVGPTRMDYPGTMTAVRAVARYVSRILDEA